MAATKLKDGDQCVVTAGTHAGKSGTVRDINVSKTGHMTLTVVQKNGERFKTLAKNVTSGKPTAQLRVRAARVIRRAKRGH